MTILRVLSAITILFLTSLSFISCSDKEKESNPLADSVYNENSNLSGKLAEKESAITEFVKAFNEIQENLNAIKEKEKIVAKSSSGNEAKNNQNKIKEDLKTIYELLERNKTRIGTITKKLKDSNLKLEGLQQMIENLQNNINIKDEEIADLKSKVDKLYKELKNLTADYKVIEEENAKKAEALNTAYYLIGSSKDLKEKNVIAKEGGFIGIGKVTRINNEFNKNDFTKLNIESTTSIKVGAKKIKILTGHPKDSYKLVGKNPIEMIEIINPKEFWSASKFLVVIIE